MVVSATQGGILSPDESKERSSEGEVIAAGLGKLHARTGAHVTNPVKTVINVLHGKYDGLALNYDDETT